MYGKGACFVEILNSVDINEGIHKWSGVAYNQEWTLLRGNAVNALQTLYALFAAQNKKLSCTHRNRFYRGSSKSIAPSTWCIPNI